MIVVFVRTKVSFNVTVGISEQRDQLAPQLIRDRDPLCSTSLYGSHGGVRAADAASVEEKSSDQDYGTAPASFRSDALEYFGSPVSRKSIRIARIRSGDTYSAFLPHVAKFQVQAMPRYQSI